MPLSFDPAGPEYLRPNPNPLAEVGLTVDSSITGLYSRGPRRPFKTLKKHRDVLLRFF